MNSKTDYYQILKIQPTATAKEIKAAFRALAKKYHPDINQGVHSTHFNQIVEAYEVLDNPLTRQEYHYQRWKLQLHFTPIITLELLKSKSAELLKLVNQIPSHHILYDVLEYQILSYLEGENLKLLQASPHESSEVISNLCKASAKLKYGMAHRLLDKMKSLTNNQEVLSELEQLLVQLKKAAQWEVWKFPVALFITILLCLLMLWAG